MFGAVLRRMDIYGHKIGVHYRGEDVYRTKVGGLVSLLTYIFVVIYTVNLVNAFLDHSEQTGKFVRIKQDLMDEEEVFNLKEQQMQISIIDRFGQVPERIGKWTIHNKK